MYEFAKCLKVARVFHGLYMGNMKYSAYKTTYGYEWIEIHPRNPLTKYCSNYIVFYYVDYSFYLMKDFNLRRFHEAQEYSYQAAFAEIKEGYKRSH